MKPLNERKVLLIEDDEPKLRTLKAFLSEILPENVTVLIAGSLSSALKALSDSKVVLAVVDMSLPTFDFAVDRAGGGQPQGFGGADILRFIESETTDTFSVVLTQYEEFALARNRTPRDVRGLEKDLKDELGERFLGVIHYAGQHGEWQELLKNILLKVGLVSAK